MEIKTNITEEFAEITIKIPQRIGKRMEGIVLTDREARLILLEKHPHLKLPELSMRVREIDNNKMDKLEATWKFKIESEPEAPKIQEEKKNSKNLKKVLNFKSKSDKVVETTTPDEIEQVKGVEEPTE